MTAERENAAGCGFCGAPVLAKGLCRRHYMRQWHAAHPGKRVEYQRAWRDRNRDLLNERRRTPLEPRTCPMCGAGFLPTNHAQVYCPPSEADRARQKGQARSRCARRAENLRYRAKYEPRRSYA